MRVLQTRDVARRLGVATSTVRRWAAEGLLPYRWAGNCRVFEPDEVRRFAGKLKAANGGTRASGGGKDKSLAGSGEPRRSADAL